MAYSFVQENTGDTGTTTPTSYTVTLASGTAAGNQLVIIVTSDATVSTPTGFTLDASQVNNNGHYVFRKATTAGETSWTVTPSGAASGDWYVAEISGLTATPLDKTASAGTGTGTGTQTTGTTAATTTDGDLALASWGTSRAVNPGPTATAYTNSFTGRITSHATSKTSGTNIGIGVASKTISPVGTVESTATTGGAAATGIMVTYKVAATGGSTVTGSGTGTANSAASSSSTLKVLAPGSGVAASTGSASSSLTIYAPGAGTAGSTASGMSTLTVNGAGSASASSTAAGGSTGPATINGSGAGLATSAADGLSWLVVTGVGNALTRAIATCAGRVPAKVFIPPTLDTGFRWDNESSALQRALYRHFPAAPVGQTVWIKDGVVYQEQDPYNLTLLDADQVFLGGHVHEVDDATAAILTAAGYTVTNATA